MNDINEKSYGWAETTTQAFPILLGIVIALIGWIYNNADQDFDKLEKSVTKMSESIREQTESTIRLNTLMAEVVIPNTTALQQDMRQVKSELEARAPIFIQSEQNKLDLAQFKSEIRSLTSDRWRRSDHDNYAETIRNQIREINQNLKHIENDLKHLKENTNQGHIK